MASSEYISVEVAYALAEHQTLLQVRLKAGATVARAIEQSGILGLHADIDPDTARVGIFGKHVTMETVLSDGDRVEIYRALIADPKEVRKLRAAQGQKLKKGGGSAQA